jgi:hypothetical protein
MPANLSKTARVVSKRIVVQGGPLRLARNHYHAGLHTA